MVKVVGFLLFCLITGTSAEASNFIAAGDAAMSAHKYDEAEASYTDAVFDTTTEKEALTKLQSLYSISGMHPLDHRVKEKLDKISQTSKPVKRAPLVAAGTSFPPVTGEAAVALLQIAKANFESACMEKVPGYRYSSGFAGSAFKLPNNQYSVLCNCDAVLNEDGTDVKAQLSVDLTMKYQDGELKIIGRSVSIVSVALADDSKVSKGEEFSKWSEKQQKEIDVLRAQEEQRRKAADVESARQAEQAMANHNAATRAGMGTSYFSSRH